MVLVNAPDFAAYIARAYIRLYKRIWTLIELLQCLFIQSVIHSCINHEKYEWTTNVNTTRLDQNKYFDIVDMM